MKLTERLRRLHRPGVRIDLAYAGWAARQAPSALTSTTGPLVSVLMPVCDTPAALLRDAIGSVGAQTTAHWELCIADDTSVLPETVALLALEADAEPRIRLVRLPARGGIAVASNAALGLATGAFVALLDHDDLLAPQALARVAAEILAHPEAALIFSDEDRLERGRCARPYFKPGWNPDLMLGQNAVSHLGAYRRSSLVALGGFRPGFDGSQDYDLALRMAQHCGPDRIRHIPEVLYHWRHVETSFSVSNAAKAGDALHRAASSILPMGAEVRAHPTLPHWNAIRHALPAPPPEVTCLLTGRGSAPIDEAYPATQTLHAQDWRQARGAVLVFVAPGLTAGGADWLRELVSQAWRDGVGAVGGRLDRADGRILHAGWVLDRWIIGRTLHPRSDLSDPGYFGHFELPRAVSAVSGDCLAIRRDLFAEVGGFDPACGRYADIDLCLRLAARGLRTVWTPQARLRVTAPTWHRPDRGAARLMRARWGDVLARDPYLNPNLDVRGGNLVLRRRPRSVST